MSKKKDTPRSVNQRVGNTARERGLARDDAFVAYAIDRFLYRLGRSSQAKEFALKGGVLVANLVDEPFRFSRDLDTLRKKGPADPEDIRARFGAVAAVKFDDGIAFGTVRAVVANRENDDYDGVKVTIEVTVEEQAVSLKIDVGFGDAVEPPTKRMVLAAFLKDDPPAWVQAYGAGTVVAEKVQTIVKKFPLIAHRLKDILDVVVLAERLAFDGGLVASMRATFERRETAADPAVLDDLREQMPGRKWETEWAAMVKDKAVRGAPGLPDALARFDTFVRPLLAAMPEGAARPGAWPPGGPWGPPPAAE